MKEEILRLKEFIKNEKTALPENVYYLNNGDILCSERKNGDSRYPYCSDGLNLWCHSSGYINAEDGDLTIFRSAFFQENTCIDFFGGLKVAENKWFPVSITGATEQIYEAEKFVRYTVFSSRAAYYIAESDKIIFAVKAFVTTDKQIVFSVSAINKTEKLLPTYISAYIEPLLRYANDEEFWGLMKRHGKLFDNGSFKIYTRQDSTPVAIINKITSVPGKFTTKSTVSKLAYFGGKGRTLFNAEALKTGLFDTVKAVNTTDMPVVGDMIEFTLDPKSEGNITYVLNYAVLGAEDFYSFDYKAKENVDLSKIEADLKSQYEKENDKSLNIKIEFGDFIQHKVNAGAFNKFVSSVHKQVTVCALGKNYAGDMLGIRDVFQQLTASLLWNEADTRAKIIKCLNFIMSDGRPPRQFSFPAKEGQAPKFDMRFFIDQGLWIIETVYNYVAYTADKSLLDESCGYYEFSKNKTDKSDLKDSVLRHIEKIAEFLVRHIDKKTGCLRAMQGDWNDSVNVLGNGDIGDGFGNGVSVMATEQLYSALKMVDELRIYCGATDKIYTSTCDKIATGLETYAVQLNDGGIKHIVHGWTNNREKIIGSIRDSDGKTRYSVNSYSFWVLSGMTDRGTVPKNDILYAYDKLDSKYGLRTFTPYFPDAMTEAGRIRTITPGTYENGATYVHAAMFAVMALFKINEPQKAWEQIFKTIPLTHDYLTKTPFVMPNSYCINAEYGIDGESLGDWYTGSGAVFSRVIIEYALGIQADLYGIKILFPNYSPTDKISAELKIKNKKLLFRYENHNSGGRKYCFNGKKYNSLLYIGNDELKNENEIIILD